MLAVLFPALLFAPQQPDVASLQKDLARVVDLPTSAARADAVDGLLKAQVVTVETWLAACRTFGTFDKLEPGPSRQKVDLQVLDQVEPTEVFLFVPKGYDPAHPAPLLLWGHGAGGDGARECLHWQDVADRIGMLVLAITESGKNEGWRFEPRERAAQLAALRWARRKSNVDENAVFVGGWSRGGHMSWDLLLRFPDLFAGAAICVGGPRLSLGPGNNMRYLENAVGVPIRDLQGAQDDPLLVADLRLAFDRLKKWHAVDAQLIEFADRGHDADLGAVDWATFFANRRTPVPKRVVRAAAEPRESRASWLAEMTSLSRVQVDAAPQVEAAAWARLDENGRRALTFDKLADITARVAIQDQGQGRFVAEGKHVKTLTLQLTMEQIGKKGAVEVRLASKTIKKTVVPEARVLVREFVERFDRTFLPVARVEVP